MQFENSLLYAKQLDEKDPLKDFRKEFIIPTVQGKEQIYFFGKLSGASTKENKGRDKQNIGSMGSLWCGRVFYGLRSLAGLS